MGVGIAEVAGPVAEVLQAAEGARADAVEGPLGSIRFDPAVDNLEVGEFQLQLHLDEETGLLAVGVEQGEAPLGKHDRQRNTGHAAAAADVQPVIPTLGHERHHRQAVEQMARHHLVGATHRGEVVGLVPLDQQAQVGEQLFLLLRAELDAQLASALQQFFGVTLSDRHQALCSSFWPALRFFR